MRSTGVRAGATRTVTAYKLLRLRKKDLSLGPLFINKSQVIEPGKWLKARCYPTPGYKVRAGWHCTHAPNAPHLSMKGRVWCKVTIRDFETVVRPECQGGLWYLARNMRLDSIL